ncbi:hypothetical protein G6038_13770 [Rhodococcus sp. 14C212]|uniref:GAP family protein n=1 Tax=Rhodococcus sp. 14C212 TaxID=2711209 RepID=UPI0013ECBA3B|nr:hypothetical protein [Rhodococcus sp. 14C212]
MTGAIGQSLPIAVGLLLAAMPMVMLSVLLVTKRPVSVSYAFVGGWVAGLLVVGAVVLAVADVIMLADEPTWWAGAVKFALGIVLVLMAVRKWRARPQAGEESTVPGWMAAAQTMTARRALRLGFLFAAANPKNLALVAAGAAVIADATARVLEQVVALVVFTVVASLGVVAPAVIRSVFTDRADPVLAVADEWMTRHHAAIMATVLLVLGLVLIGNGIAGL